MMVRVTTANSVYLYDKPSETIVCLAGTHAGWINRNMRLEPIAINKGMCSVPGSDYFRSTVVLDIEIVENEINPHLFN